MKKKDRQLPRIIERLELQSGAGEGHSIARYENRVIFVKYGAPGDLVDVKIVGRKKKYFLAEIVHFHEKSDLRQDPLCSHFGVCGGCKWQHMRYEEQLKLKQQWVLDCFERIGKLTFENQHAIIGSEKTAFYRNKLEYTFSNKRWLLEGEEAERFAHLNALGFHVPGRFDKVLQVEKCHLQDDFSNTIRNYIYNYAIESGLSFYDLREHQGLLRNLILRNTRDGQWMLILCFGEDQPKEIKALMDQLVAEFKTLSSVYYVINTKQNDTIFDLDLVHHSGASVIVEKIADLEFEISPKSFFQTNSEQTELLYKRALDIAKISKSDTVYDLYCGTGTITLFAAQYCKQAIGVEIVQEAIQAANRNAKRNKLQNVQFVAGQMRDVFNASFYQEYGKPDVIITDPPRAGMHKDVLAQLLEIRAPKIVYISCNPATQARDLEVLSATYRIVELQPVDMFPHTHHCENIVLLELV